MNVMVRYFSASGNTKKIAEAIAEGINVEAKSIIEEPVLTTHANILFLGGAPYANIMAKKLREYALNIKKEDVDKVVLFTTSNWSRRTVRALRKIFKEKGIEVEKEYFYAHMLRINKRIPKAKEFGKKFVDE